MADTRTPEQRRRIMQAVGTRDTKPELILRRALHAMGHRYRLHDRKLPGSPDIVFPGRKKVIYVNGCFWHFHGCPKGQLPKSRHEYWEHKLKLNRKRDRTNIRELKALGWSALVVWQCNLKEISSVLEKIDIFLN